MTEKGPKISFVIPAYNCADTLAESVESIIDGNFEDGDEIIIVNDASTDKTTTVIEKIIAKHPSIKVIRNAVNKGCPASRNIGIRIAKNPLVFNLDSDNVLAHNSIPKLKKYLIEQDADLAAFGEYHYFIDCIAKITHKWICKPGIMGLANFLSGHINPGPGGNFLYTKKSWDKIGGYWEYGNGLHEAWGFTLKQLANGAKLAVLKDTHYFHRHGLESLFVRESKQKGSSSLMATKMIMNFISLIDEEDARYIRSESGSREWFEKLSERPIRLKTGEVGTTGRKINLKPSGGTKNTMKKLTPNFLKVMAKRIIYYARFMRDFSEFKRLSASSDRFPIYWRNRYPQLNDRTAMTPFDAHYIYHPAWAAYIVKSINPQFHIDISSTLSFSTIISAFIPVRFYDYRPAHIELDGLTSGKADLQHLPFDNDSVASLSCMHTIEHIGLGRYGDPLDPDGDVKAINELVRVLAPGGSLLFVVPIGKQKILFNAHRIYSYDQIMRYFSGLELKEFSLIPDDAVQSGMVKNATKQEADLQNYACGCFWFIKKQS